MDAARPLRSMLDRLAALRWAPLAADAAAAELLAGPAARVAGLAPDPLQALARVTSATPAVAGTAAPEGRSPRSAAARVDRGLQGRAPTPAGAGTAASPGARPASLEPPLPIFRAAQASTPVLPLLARSAGLPPPVQAVAGAPPIPLQWPADAPAARTATQSRDLPAQASALLQRFAAASSAVPLSAQRLRELAHPQPVRPAATGQGAPVAAPRSLADLVPQQPTTAAAAAAPAERASGVAASPDPRSAPQRTRSTAVPDSPPEALPVPRGRTSALSDLLRRWPGAAAPGEDAASARSPLAAALPTPDTATPAWPAGPQPAAAPAHPGDLARPALPASDLQFGRTLERVLLAEVRRQGLDVEPE